MNQINLKLKSNENQIFELQIQIQENNLIINANCNNNGKNNEFSNNYSFEELKFYNPFSNFNNLQQVFNYLKTNLNQNNISISEEKNLLKISIFIQLNNLLFLLPMKNLEQKEINKILFNNIANINNISSNFNHDIKFLINKVIEIENILTKKQEIEINKRTQIIKKQLQEENEKILNEELKKIKKLEEDKLNELKKKEDEYNIKVQKLKEKEDFINQEISEIQKFADENKIFEIQTLEIDDNNENENVSKFSDINMTDEELKEENIKSWELELKKSIKNKIIF
jgi:hypothetical protein